MTRAMLDGMDDFWRMRAWLDISALREERRARILPFIVAWARRGASLSGERVFRGYSQMAAMREAAVAACRPYDIVLSPTVADRRLRRRAAEPDQRPRAAVRAHRLHAAVNMSEQPAASIDCGRTPAGLPIGLQIIGHRHDDLGVLQVARAWEAMRPAPRAVAGAAGTLTRERDGAMTRRDRARQSRSATASAAALDASERALWRMMSFYGTPIDDLDAAIAADPAWPLPRLMKAGFLLSLTEPALVGDARGAARRGRPRRRRRRARARPPRARCSASPPATGSAPSEPGARSCAAHPRDALALQWAHLFDFYRGDATQLRAARRRGAAGWPDDDPLHPYVLALHAFGLEESGRYAAGRSDRPARARRRRARALGDPCRRPRDGDAGPPRGGRALAGAQRPQWGARGRPRPGPERLRRPPRLARGAVRARDARHRRARCASSTPTSTRPGIEITLQRVDAASLLWRMRLLGADVGDRWRDLLAGWRLDAAQRRAVALQRRRTRRWR